MTVQLGEVLVTTDDCANPYTYRGPLAHQNPPDGCRVEALSAFAAGHDTSGLVLWHAPAFGGARVITRDEVDWRGLRPTS